MNEGRYQRYKEAYVMMARLARYRPGAPSDGHGNIQLTRDELNDDKRLRREAEEYAIRFSEEEDTREFHVGCSFYNTNRAFIWTIEAARQLAGGGDETAKRLLDMARRELERFG